MKVQVIKAPQGEEMVVVSRADFEQLRELADDRLDAEAAAAVLRRIASQEDEVVPAAVADRLFGGENPIKVWREYRGFTQTDLATKAGLSSAYLSQIESGQRGGSTGVLQSIARSLDVDLESVVTVSDLMQAKRSN